MMTFYFKVESYLVDKNVSLSFCKTPLVKQERGFGQYIAIQTDDKETLKIKIENGRFHRNDKFIFVFDPIGNESW